MVTGRAVTEMESLPDEATLNAISQCLAQTMEINANTRKNAELTLTKMETNAGFTETLLFLIAKTQANDQIKMAAAICVKNFAKKAWSDTADFEVPEEEQIRLRGGVMQVMYMMSGNIREQLSHALFLIAKKDFPEKWPDLVDNLADRLLSENLDHIIPTLETLDQLFEKYRYESKSNALWLELKKCLLATQKQLTDVYAKMLETSPQKDQLSAADAERWLKTLFLIARVYHSLACQDLPEYFEDNLNPWMMGYTFLLSMEVANDVSTAGDATYLDKLKAEICGIITLYAQRYEEEIKPYMQGFIEAIWNLLVKVGGETRFDSLVCAALDFLAAICQRPQYEAMFVAEGVIRTIAEGVAVKNLVLREEDIELFEDEPIEYMKKDIEGTDSGTRRRGAIDLIRGLCHRFEDKIVPILSESVSTIVGTSNWIQKDVVYCIVAAMASKGGTQKTGVTATSQLVNVVDFYRQTVRQDLATEINSSAIIKADAIKFLVTFRSHLPVEDLIEASKYLRALLGSKHTQVHKYVAWAFDRLLVMKVDGKLIFSSSNIDIADMLTALMQCFSADPKAQNSPYLMKATMRIMNIMDAATAAAGSQIATRLVQMVDEATRNPADPVHTHYLFEAMCVLIRKAGSIVQGGLAPSLFPLVEIILSQDIQDLVPYALQLTGVLLADAFKNGRQEQCHVILPVIIKPELWQRSSNIPAALYVVQIFMKHDPQSLLSKYSNEIFHQFARLIASKNLDHLGFQLITSMLPVLDQATVENPYPTVLNHMFKRIQNSKTAKFTKGFLVFVARFMIIKGATFFYQTVESIQQGLFKMIAEKVILSSLVDMKQLTTLSEKRDIAIGFAGIYRDGGCNLGELLVPVAEKTLELIDASAVTSTFSLAQEDEQEKMYNAEGEFVNPYSKLTYAAETEVYAEQIQDHRGFFTENAQRLLSSST